MYIYILYLRKFNRQFHPMCRNFVTCFRPLILNRFISSIFLHDFSNWMIRSMYRGPRSTLLMPRLQRVCLGRGLVGYWKGYFNHKRCRRRCTFQASLDDTNFLYVPNPPQKYIPSLRNKVFDLLIVVFLLLHFYIHCSTLDKRGYGYWKFLVGKKEKGRE